VPHWAAEQDTIQVTPRLLRSLLTDTVSCSVPPACTTAVVGANRNSGPRTRYRPLSTAAGGERLARQHDPRCSTGERAAPARDCPRLKAQPVTACPASAKRLPSLRFHRLAGPSAGRKNPPALVIHDLGASTHRYPSSTSVSRSPATPIPVAPRRRRGPMARAHSRSCSPDRRRRSRCSAPRRCRASESDRCAERAATRHCSRAGPGSR